MKSRGRALSLSAPPVLVFAWLAWAACDRGGARPDLVYRFDAGTRGWVVIVFDRPEAQPLPKLGDAYLMDVPRSGVLVTSTRQWVGRGRDVFRRRDASGRESPVSPELIRAHRTGVRKTDGGTPIEYEVFFVGTEAELGVAESDGAALSRALATLRGRG